MALDWKKSPQFSQWPGCLGCRWRRADLTCRAYPDGIAIRIASGEVDHLVKRPDQVGSTVFEART